MLKEVCKFAIESIKNATITDLMKGFEAERYIKPVKMFTDISIEIIDSVITLL